MNLNFWVIQTFNGISYGALLFLVGSGLSLIFGVMRIVNLSHGSYFMLGGYVALTVIWTTGSWLLAIPVAAITIALLGLAMERIFLRQLGFDPLRQVLLTVGFAFLFQQAALDLWTGNNFDINPPAVLSQSIPIGGVYLPLYRVFMIAIAAAIGLVLWLVMEKTRIGAQVRATSTTRRWPAASVSTLHASPWESLRWARSSRRSVASSAAPSSASIPASTSRCCRSHSPS